MKRKNITHLNVWFVLGEMVWVHPKTAKTVSSTTGAFVGVVSLRPWIGHSAMGQLICLTKTRQDLWGLIDLHDISAYLQKILISTMWHCTMYHWLESQ
jgi:hypothetical protein